MPNWCYNKLEIRFQNEQSDALHNALFSYIESDQLSLDFNCLLPMPKELNIPACHRTEPAFNLLQLDGKRRLTYPIIYNFIDKDQVKRIYKKAKQHHWTVSDFIRWLSKRPKEQTTLNLDISLGQQYCHNLNQYGYTDWYEWCCATWGCKWNADLDSCSIFLGESGNCITCCFDTPWSPPTNWFKTLCHRFPEVNFTLSYFEPGMWFAGYYQSVGTGNCFHLEISDSEIKQFAIDVFDEEFDEE